MKLRLICLLPLPFLFSCSTAKVETPGPRLVQAGGKPVVQLKANRPFETNKPYFTSATILPGRGMNIYQITANLPGRGAVNLITAPPLEQAAKEMTGGPDDMIGNKSFAYGGAILLPYANRITGKLSADGKTIETVVAGKTITLPANWGGKQPGARKYAMHGLILDAPFDIEHRVESALRGHYAAGNFNNHWPSAADVAVETKIDPEYFSLTVIVKNVGNEPLPIGIGWHPYFALPSGNREQARLALPARMRAPANNYDEVLPTGQIVPVAGTPFDFTAHGGAELKKLFLDDNFTDLVKNAQGYSASEIIDPAAKYGLRITAYTAEVNAIQVYAPVDKPFVVLEPQFNLADPYSSVWKKGTNTGMVLLPPGETVRYNVRLELFEP